MNIQEKRELHKKELQNATKKIVESANDKMNIDVTNVADLKRVYSLLKSGFPQDLGVIAWNKPNMISIAVGLLISEKMVQSANKSRTLIINMLKEAKTHFNIDDKFFEDFLNKKFMKLKAFNIDLSRMDTALGTAKVNEEAMFSMEQINKIIDNSVKKIDNKDSEVAIPDTKDEKLAVLPFLQKAWSILGSVRLTPSNIQQKIKLIETKIFQFKGLTKTSSESGEKKMKMVRTFMFILMCVSVLDEYKLTLADFKNKIIDKTEPTDTANAHTNESLLLENTDVEKFAKLSLNMLSQAGVKCEYTFESLMKEVKQMYKTPTMQNVSDLIGKKLDKRKLKEMKLFENETSAIFGGYTNQDPNKLEMALYDKIEPQYMEWLVQFQGQVLQNDFGRWKQFFEFSFKNSLKKITEQERMFVELQRVIFDTLTNKQF